MIICRDYIAYPGLELLGMLCLGAGSTLSASTDAPRTQLAHSIAGYHFIIDSFINVATGAGQLYEFDKHQGGDEVYLFLYTARQKTSDRLHY